MVPGCIGCGSNDLRINIQVNNIAVVGVRTIGCIIHGHIAIFEITVLGIIATETIFIQNIRKEDDYFPIFVGIIYATIPIINRGLDTHSRIGWRAVLESSRQLKYIIHGDFCAPDIFGNINITFVANQFQSAKVYRRGCGKSFATQQVEFPAYRRVQNLRF